VVVVLVLVAPGLGVPASAGSGDGFTFHGSGYGHGLGMSQWGAYGLAQMGWGHAKILRHFYRGTRVQAPGDLPGQIRVGLTTDRTAIHLKALDGPVRLWEGAARSGALVGIIDAGRTWVVKAKPDGFVVRDHTGALVGDRRWGSRAVDLELSYEGAGSRVLIPEADAVNGIGFSYNRGAIELDLYDCGDVDLCQVRVIARLGMQAYLYGLGEVPSSWPAATLRAQAVAARTYAVYDMRHGSIRPECDCHITDGSNDQVYVGYAKEGGVDGDRWVAAVEATDDQVVTYLGTVIQSFYAASDGGHSDNVEDVWHGGNDAYAISWLRGVCDPGESTTANPWIDWSRSFDAGSLTARLASYTGSIGTIRRFTQIERGVGGRIVSAVAKGATGTAIVTGGELRSGLALPDGRVWINADRNITGAIRERYDALGCAPGFATSPTRTVTGGAQQFFDDGGLYRNAAQDLVVWLRGLIDQEYRAVGAGTGTLGVPIGSPVPIGARVAACDGCKRVAFVHGRIYLKVGLGAHALWGPVLDAYLGEGGATGVLGFPVSRVRRIVGGGAKARFEHGHIECHADGCTVSAS